MVETKRGAAWPLFLISFLVLFLEVTLIRWMPAYIRLLAYFSNFILLASFLGIGIGCLLAPIRANLLRWFPIDELPGLTVFPEFLRTAVRQLPDSPQHIVQVDITV